MQNNKFYDRTFPKYFSYCNSNLTSFLTCRLTAKMQSFRQNHRLAAVTWDSRQSWKGEEKYTLQNTQSKREAIDAEMTSTPAQLSRKRLKFCI